MRVGAAAVVRVGAVGLRGRQCVSTLSLPSYGSPGLTCTAPHGTCVRCSITSSCGRASEERSVATLTRLRLKRSLQSSNSLQGDRWPCAFTKAAKLLAPLPWLDQRLLLSGHSVLELQVWLVEP